MNTVILNIGLGNNPVMATYIASYLTEHFNANSFIATGKWQGADEPTIVARIETEITFEQVLLVVRGMCCMYTQTAIAMRYNGRGILVYRENSAEKRDVFDSDYFIEWSEEPRELPELINRSQLLDALERTEDFIVTDDHLSFIRNF